MNYRFRAIETPYRGGIYRSRLEAQWAVLFDLMGYRFTYEPFTTGSYIPDFLVYNLTEPHCPTLAEVRPCMTPDDYYDAAAEMQARLKSADWPHNLLILGADAVSPFPPGPGCAFTMGWHYTRERGAWFRLNWRGGTPVPRIWSAAHAVVRWTLPEVAS